MDWKKKSITLVPFGVRTLKDSWKVLNTKNILEWYPGQIISQSEYANLVGSRSIDVYAKELKAT